MNPTRAERTESFERPFLSRATRHASAFKLVTRRDLSNEVPRASFRLRRGQASGLSHDGAQLLAERRDGRGRCGPARGCSRRRPQRSNNLRVGDVFLKVDADRHASTSKLRRWPWHRSRLRKCCGGSHPCSRSPRSQGRHSGASASPSTASSAAWATAGAAVRTLHETPLPPWPGKTWTASPRPSTASANGSSPIASFPPTWSPATAASPTLPSGRGRQFHPRRPAGRSRVRLG